MPLRWKVLIYGFTIFTALTTNGRGEAMSFSDLSDLIRTQSPKSIEELLPHLPAEYLENYALVFRSRSLQAASFENPRALLFGKNAELIISFNGHPDQKGFGALETMEFDSSKKEFLYREITFPDSISNQDKVKISQANPERCVKCHGTPARPVWDSHPEWPGVYGEKYLSALSAQEKAGIQSFLKIQPYHTRYKNLRYVEKLSDPNTYVPSAKIKYFNADQEPPNEKLSMALSRFNAQRIAHEIAEAHDFEKYQYWALAAVSSSCEFPETFSPEAQAGLFNVWQNLQKMTQLQNEKQLESKQLRMSESQIKDGTSLPMETLDRLRLVAEIGLDLKTDRWSTALEVSTYDFSAIQPVSKEIEKELLKITQKKDAKLLELYQLSQIGSGEKYCRYLREKTRQQPNHELIAKLNSIESRHSTKAVAGSDSEPPALMRKCFDCHQGGIAPSIPFDRPEVLKHLLARGHYRHGPLLEEIRYRLSPNAGADRMPLIYNTTESERIELLKYLSQLEKL